MESNFSGLWTSQTIEAAQRSPLGMCKSTLYKILDRFLRSADLCFSGTSLPSQVWRADADKVTFVSKEGVDVKAEVFNNYGDK